MELSERDLTILDLEQNWWSRPGSKHEQVVDALDMSITRYHELLDELIELPAAKAYDPLLVLRLRRMRDDRRRSRRFVESPIEENG